MRIVQLSALLCLPLALAGCQETTVTFTPTPVTSSGQTFGFNSGPLISSGARPVPITGGTLLVSRDGQYVAAADPERDTVSIVNLASSQLVATLSLRDGVEPGRMAEDHGGHIYVATRRGGELVRINLLAATPEVDGHVKVCAAPRGVTYDPYQDVLHVACAGGELVSVDRAQLQIARTVNIPDGDLRDVLVATSSRGGVAHPDGSLLVSQFRSARLLRVDSAGAVQAVNEVPDDSCSSNMTPDVAWRTVPIGTTGQIAMLHQRARSADAPPVSTAPGGYAGGGISGCASSQGIVKSAVSVFDENGSALFSGTPLTNVMLAVDVAFTHDGQLGVIAVPGNIASPFSQVQVRDASGLTPFSSFLSDSTGFFSRDIAIRGQAIAVAFRDDSHVIVQTREPSLLEIIDLENASAYRSVTLATDSRADTGQYIFHAGVSAGEACASCHPEGGEDGHVWSFDSLGARRTPQISGGMLGTEPFHWSGDMHDFRDLVTHVFSERMGAGTIPDAHAEALAQYVDGIEAPPPSLPDDMSAVERGQALFESTETQCTTCHSGPMLTNNATVDVGTGGSFQVPSLVGVGNRTPLIHNGCAANLHERFTDSCAGGDHHGHTSQLRTNEIDDLVAFLKTL